MTYTQRRADGWPLCPRCGEDELWSPTSDEAGIRGCYVCSWTPLAFVEVDELGEPTTSSVRRWLDAEAAAAVARYKHQDGMRERARLMERMLGGAPDDPVPTPGFALDAAAAVFLTDHGNSFHRLLLEAPGSPGQVGIFGEVLAPPGFRLETDAELRERIKTALNQEEL